MAYNASTNNVFFRRLHLFADHLQGLRDEAQRLNDLWVAEGISADADFTDVDGVTTAEATSLVVLLGDFDKFMTNKVVSTADRVASATPFLTNSGLLNG